ncbi:MAG: kelch repeat-containing protein, partial [Nitrosopumilaceae archaeon]
GEIYVVGGIEDGWIETDSLFIYSQENDSWREATNMPTKRGALTAQFIDGVLYAVGGSTRIAMDTNEAYNPETDSWEKKTLMLTARDHLTSAVLGGKMYVIGGRSISLATNLGTNEVYDPATDSWTSLESMPTPRGGIAAAEIGGSIFVFGGEQTSGTFSENEQYIPNEGWFSHKSMPTSRHGLGAAAVDDRIYVIGGGVAPGLSVSNVNESYYNANFVPEFGVLSFVVLGVSFTLVVILYSSRRITMQN